MKLPPFQFAPKKKLRATAARRASASGAEFEDFSEPNMKLSRALLIVLVLHVVAVAGIIAFNAIKTRQGPAPLVSSKAPSRPTAEKAEPQPTASASARSETVSKQPARPEKKTKSNEPTPVRSYTVSKGDTPVSIAKKFKVPYDQLLAANHIEDARKLKIGQKLIIPAKPSKSKKAAD